MVGYSQFNSQNDFEQCIVASSGKTLDPIFTRVTVLDQSILHGGEGSGIG